MAEFKKAYKHTAAFEGGYVNDPEDAGGETYKGISRRFHPSWRGWKTVDRKKLEPSFPANLKQSVSLQRAIKEFYKQVYWDRFWGDSILNQDIANELFDTSVNLGVRRAVRFLQQGLNLLNRNQKIYADILEDGFFGPNTLKSVEAYLQRDPASYLLKIMNTLQGMHYLEYMKKDPVQEKYARGWLRRTSLPASD